MTDDTKAAAGWTKAKLYAEMKKVTRERDEAQAKLTACHRLAWPRGGDLNGDPVCDLMLAFGTNKSLFEDAVTERDAARLQARELESRLGNTEAKLENASIVEHKAVEALVVAERERDEALAAYASTREASIAQVNFANAEAQRFQTMLLEAKAANASVAARDAALTAAYQALDEISHQSLSAIGSETWSELQERLLEFHGVASRAMAAARAVPEVQGNGQHDAKCPTRAGVGFCDCDAPRAVPVVFDPPMTATNAVTSAVIHTEPVHLYNAPRAVPVERVRELMTRAHGLGLQHVKLDALLKEVES